MSWFVFFFKQKTAYEMRISDWSSDVCSSDLSLKVVMLEQNYRSTSRILKCANILIANNPHVFEKQLWSEMGHGDEIRVIRTRNEDAECEREIGRASGRESVCQYV